jgi:hypothetical protein
MDLLFFYLVAFLVFFVLFYIGGLNWLGSFVLALAITFLLTCIVFPGFNTGIQGEFITFFTFLALLFFVVFSALKLKR